MVISTHSERANDADLTWWRYKQAPRVSQPSVTNPKVHFDHKTTFCASPAPLLVPIKSSQELALVSQEKCGSCSFPAPKAEDIFLQGVFFKDAKGEGNTLSSAVCSVSIQDHQLNQ